MGFLRGSLLFFAFAVLLTSLVALNSLFVLKSTLEYENVQGTLKAVLVDSTPTGNLEALNFSHAQNHCVNETEYVFSYKGNAFSVFCETISEGEEAFVDEAINSVAMSIYYANYTCDFWDCFLEENPMFLISEKSHDYWQGKLWIMFFVSLVLIGLVFLLVEQKQNFPVVIGIALIIAALPLLKLDDILASAVGAFSSGLTGMFSGIKALFWINLVLGILLIGFGIAWRFWMPESLKKKFSRKDIMKIVKDSKK